mmetsp:Transcript_22673/g.56145  ORF Transcript_22673/g.56145 Transcript_22673/m.56145 type:complete len:488 (+) Transcript_22673:226-1689(+)
MFAVSLPSEANGEKKNPSIIDMANAAYSMTPSSSAAQQLRKGDGAWSSRSRNNSTSSINLDERLDAARAMLGISPCSVVDGSVGSLMGGRGGATFKQQRQSSGLGSSEICGDKQGEASVADTDLLSGNRRPRSNSAGLDALAFLATQEQEAALGGTTKTKTTVATNAQTTVPYSSVSLVANPAVTSSDDDSEIMPPPPPRTTVTRRRRSVSNPEGMGKWGLPITMDDDNNSTTMRRLRLVLPVSILEEEIAEANAAVIAKEKSTASASALAASLLSQKGDIHGSSNTSRSQPPLVEDDEDENLDHDELLRRARSRLLEDLSQSNISGEKGVLTLPHSLGKYKEVYNKNGRIGIYTPAERAAIIARFQSKRTRRVWNKKIRYNCRKNLADRRLRVKGRFVKRSAVTETTAKETPKIVPATTDDASEKTIAAGGGASSGARSSVTSIPEETEVGQPENDTEMPDVSDPDAGFCPTDDQPYRRLRRHTIT